MLVSSTHTASGSRTEQQYDFYIYIKPFKNVVLKVQYGEKLNVGEAKLLALAPNS